MITLKLSAYTPGEVDIMYSTICRTVNDLMHFNRPLCERNGCNVCKHKRVCDDMGCLARFLKNEMISGYPHCKRKNE